LPEFQIEVGAARAALTQGAIDAQGGTLRWQAAGDAAAESLTARFADGEAGALQLARAELMALKANQPMRFAADTLAIDGVDLYLTRSLLLALLGRGSAVAQPTAASADAAVERATASSTSRTPAPELDVRRVQTLLTQLGYEPGAVDGLMGRRTSAAISAFQRREGLSVDGQLSASLLRALEVRTARPDDSDAVPAAQPASVKAAGSGVHLGRLAVSGNRVLRFRDDMTTPKVTLESVFREFEVHNLDTQSADQRIDLRVTADVDELTRVAIAGWISALRTNADLDVTAKVEDLQLSTYSPYVAELAGVSLDSGQLDATAQARAAKGSLQGAIQLDIADIAFRPLSEEEAGRVTEAAGVPLETAVQLLEDVDGRISLNLPITGTLSKPDVDIGPAVRKAIGNALKNVFPPILVASMLGGIAEGGGPRFESIEFAPGSAELSEVAKGYAAALAQLLAERPELSLRLCGRATAQDMQAVAVDARSSARRPAGAGDQIGDARVGPLPDQAQAEQALTELAAERNRAVRRYLIKEKGVAAGRVSECRSTFEAADRGSPRVEVSL
jgi:peptidoglycan hydrolase-like protein with peptidoglycan-binding domain